MRNDNLYTTGGIVKKLGINYIRLRDWLRQGYIQPSVSVSEGQGSPNIFDQQDVLKIAIFKRLVELGFSRRTSSRLASAVRSLRAKEAEAPSPWLMISLHPNGEVNINPIYQLRYFLKKADSLSLDSIVILNVKKMWADIFGQKEDQA